MKALSKDQSQEREALIDGIRVAYVKLYAAITFYNAIMGPARLEVQEKLSDLNSKIQEVKEWTEGISSDMQNYFDESSERWQDGKNGQNFLSWKKSYENLNSDDVNIDLPQDLGVPECAVVDDLVNLPDKI